jgi:hypothetical protein
MNLITFLFFIINILFNVQANIIVKRKLICSIKKKEHIKRLLKNNIITIHDTEKYYNKHYYYHEHICPLVKDFVVNNSNSLELIKNEYLNKIYNIHNFPFTYRKNITLKITKDDIFRYNEEHCSFEKNNTGIYIILTIFFIMIFWFSNCFY